MKKKWRFIIGLILLLALFSILFIYAMFQGGFTSWFLFYSYLPIFLYQLGFALYPMKKWQLTRHIKNRMNQAGDDVMVTITVKRKFPFPLFYCICEEIVPDSLKRKDKRNEKYIHLAEPEKWLVNRKIKQIVFPFFRRTFNISYQLQQVPRGIHRLKPLRIRTGDIFGFIKKEYVFDVADELIVYPNERPLQIMKQLRSFERGSVTSSFVNLRNTNVVSSVREYVPGDRFSWIDWKQTAKKQEMMTKEFEQEHHTDVMLICDACDHQGINHLAFEAAIEISLSFIKAIEKKAKVSLLTIGEKSAFFPTANERMKIEDIRHYLAGLKPSKQVVFSKKLQEERAIIPSQHVLYFILLKLDHAFVQVIQQMMFLNQTLHIILIQAEKDYSREQHAIIQKLVHKNIGVTRLTENQLCKDPLEVMS